MCHNCELIAVCKCFEHCYKYVVSILCNILDFFLYYHLFNDEYHNVIYFIR
jgi:hypothetical protein